jgi:hypothetical protein
MAMVLTVIFATMVPAQAAGGRIFIHAESTSVGGVVVEFASNGTASRYHDRVYPGEYHGESSPLYTCTDNCNDEPVLISVEPGWCLRFEYNDSGYIYTFNNSNGVQRNWTNVHPGNIGIGTTWKIDVRRYDC